MSDPPVTYDVLCAGGGPAGALTAIALRRLGCSTLVVDPLRDPAWPVGEHISPRTRRALESAGAWPQPPAKPWLECTGIDARWGGAPVPHDYLIDPYGRGAHLDRARFDEALRDRAQSEGATVVPGARVVAVSRAPGRMWAVHVVGTGGARTYRLRFLVDATGRSARLGRLLGAQRQRYDRLVAVVAYLALRSPDAAAAEPTSTRLLVEAVRDGWWYVARIPGHRWVAACLTDADVLPRDRRGLEPLWRRLLAETTDIAAALPPAVQVEHVAIRSAETAWLCPTAGERWLVVGDAALSTDPLGANGIANARLTAERAAAAIRAALDGRDDGLTEYGDWLRSRVTRFLEERRVIYGLVTRWADAPFWRRRQAGAPGPAASRPRRRAAPRPSRRRATRA